MDAEELRDRFTVHGYEARVRGGEVQLRTCLYCGNDRWNLELSPAKGVFNCWACDQGSGPLAVLLERVFGVREDIPVRLGEGRPGQALPPADTSFRRVPVTDVPSAARYLTRRGVPPPVANQYSIEVCTESDHQLEGRLVFPLWDFWTGTLLGHLGRSYTGRVPKYLSTLPNRPLTGMRHRGRRTPVVVVEGFLDGVAVHRAGFSAAVLSGVTGQAEQLASRLAPETPLVVLLDGAARELAERLYWTVQPIHPCSSVVYLPPALDPGDLTPAVLAKVLARELDPT